MKEDPRKVLSQAKGMRGKPAVDWLKRHPETKEFITVWIQMKKNGESDWSAEDVLKHLREHHNYPYSSLSGFLSLLRRKFPEFHDL